MVNFPIYFNPNLVLTYKYSSHIQIHSVYRFHRANNIFQNLFDFKIIIGNHLGYYNLIDYWNTPWWQLAHLHILQDDKLWDDPWVIWACQMTLNNPPPDTCEACHHVLVLQISIPWKNFSYSHRSGFLWLLALLFSILIKWIKFI